MRKFVAIALTLALGASLAGVAVAAPRGETPALRGTYGSPLAPRRSLGGANRFLARIGARYVGHAKINLMTIDVATPMRNERALKAYARASNTPGTVYYRRWITPQQIGDSFGTPAGQYATTVAYFKSFGLAVRAWKTRTSLTVTGSSTNLENALQTKFGLYVIRVRGIRKPIEFFAPETNVSVPASIGVASISHLVSLNLNHLTYMITSPPVPINAGFANARVNGATPSQIAKAFDYTGAYAAGFSGKGVNLGVIGTGPISLQDVPNMRTLFKVPGSSTVTIVPATVNGDSTPPPVTGPCSGGVLSASPVGLPINDPTAGSSTSPTATCNPEDEEAQLDTEQTSLLAIDANVLFYLAYNGNGCFLEENPIGGGCIGPAATSQGLDLSDDELMQSIDDDRADILSLSYGSCELGEEAFGIGQLGGLTPTPGGDATGTDPTLFAELASEGIAVFVSSGDSGSAGCQRLSITGFSDAPNASYPSTDPNVVSVGGTTTPMGPDGRLLGPITNWGSQTQSGGAAGAGQSTLFETPPFQQNNTGTTVCSMRCQPDVALDADPYTGAAVVFNSGTGQGGMMEVPIGGTSQSAPEMAAMWALVLSACKVTPSCGGGYSGHVSDPPTFTLPSGIPAYRLGNPNYLWYPLAASARATQYHNTFYDIVYGDDAVPPFAVQEAAAEGAGEGVPVNAYATTDPGAVDAGPGFDQASGLGAPFARALIRFIVGV